MDELYLILIAVPRWVLGAIFVLAAATKWLDLSSFQRTVTTLGFIPRIWISYLAIGVAGFETIVGLALLLNWQHQIAATLSFGVILTFTGVLVIKFRRGETEGCGCFGSRLDKEIGHWTFIRNALLLGLSLLVFFTPTTVWNPLIVPLTILVVISVVAWWLSHSKPTTQTTQTEPILSSTPTISTTSQSYDAVSRRDFLRKSGLAGLGLLGAGVLYGTGVTPVFADLPCYCQQYYSHYEGRCGISGCSAERVRHHVWRRICDPCYCGCNVSRCCGGFVTEVSNTCEWCECFCDSKGPCNCSCGYDCCEPCYVCTEPCGGNCSGCSWGY